MTSSNFFTTTLAQALTDSGAETEIFVTSIKTLDGETLSTAAFSVLGKGYLTVDPQSSQRVERISFTGVSSTDVSFTGAVRGLLNIGGAGSSSTNANYHPVGSPVIISFGADDLNDLIAYVNSVALAGAPNASTTVKGIVQLPTQAQVDARTTTGSTGALLDVTPDKLRSTLLSDYVADTGSANAYAIAPTPAITAYTTGQMFSFKAANGNTTTSTLNVNSLGTKNIYVSKNGALAALSNGDIVTGQIVVVQYDGTEFQMVTTPASMITTTTTQTNLQTSFTAAETISAGQSVSMGPYQSDGGVLLDAKSIAALTAAGGIITTSFTVANHSNRLLVVYVGHASGSAISGITFNGTSLTRAFTPSDDTVSILDCYYLIAPTATTANLQITGVNATENCGVSIYSYYNVVQSSPIGTAVTTQAASAGSVTKAVTVTTIGSTILSGLLTESSGGSYTYTNMNNNTSTQTTYATNFQLAAGDSFLLANADTKTVSASASGTRNYILGNIEIKPFTAVSYYVSKSSSATSTVWNTSWKATAFIGFAAGASTVTNPISVITDGVVTGQSSLTVPDLYYLADTAGNIGTSAGTISRKIGIATSTTSLVITNEP